LARKPWRSTFWFNIDSFRLVGKPYITGLGKGSPSPDHNPEWCAPGDTFQKPFSLPQPGECSLQNRIAGHSSILTRVTRIA
jgi:hypothetical protein